MASLRRIQDADHISLPPYLGPTLQIETTLPISITASVQDSSCSDAPRVFGLIL